MFLKKRPSGARRGRRARSAGTLATRGAALLLCSLLPSAPALAADRMRVIPRISLSEEYTSNVLQSEDDEQSDFVTRIVPGIQLESAGDTGHTRLDLSLPSRIYKDTHELDSVDRALAFEMDRKIAPRLATFVNGDWREIGDTDPVSEVTFVEGSTDPVISDIYTGSQAQRSRGGSGGFRYSFTPRTHGILTFGVFDVDTDQDPVELANPVPGGRRTLPQFDSDDYTAELVSVGWRHSLTPLDEIGATLSWQQIDFEAGFGGGTTPFAPCDTDGNPGDDSFCRFDFDGQTDRIWQAQGSWSRSWSPRWTTSLTAGLRSLSSEGGTESIVVPIDGSPPRVSNADSTSLAFTGDALLRRNFARGYFELGWSQQTRPSSSLGDSQDVSALRASLRQQLTSRWALGLYGARSRFKAATESEDPQDSDLDTTIWYGRAQLDWQVRRRLTTFFAYEFLDQDASDRFAGYVDNRLRVGFRYDYDIDVP